jgi:hypothetical protein
MFRNIYIFLFFYFGNFPIILLSLETSNNPLPSLKVLHLTFHKGCANEFIGVAKHLNLNLTTWYVHDLPPLLFDGKTSGSALYNIGHERAENIWNLHKDFFEQFDVILTSDTAPLARIFLQNNCSIPLIIWICNRFDYYDAGSLDCDFPDSEYYALFKKASTSSNVTFISYMDFDWYYARQKGIDIGTLVIKPCASYIEATEGSLIPPEVDKKTTYFLPPYHNETIYMNFSSFLNSLNIPNYCGRYNGAKDLSDFKGIIHLPYSWAVLSFYENMQEGIPYFIPSRQFFNQLARGENYFHPNLWELLGKQLYDLSDWYNPQYAEIITYFDSWPDLKEKLKNCNYPAMREKIQAFAKKHQDKTLKQWEKVFNDILSKKRSF